MGSNDYNCKQSSHSKNSAAAFIISRKDFIITPVNGPRKSCGCKGPKPDLRIEPVHYEIIKSFVPARARGILPGDEDEQQRRFLSTMPLTAEEWFNGPDTKKEATALDVCHHLRMPNLVLDDGIYASEITPDARFIYEPHVHTSTQHDVQQQHFHGGSPQDLYGISHFGVSQVETISDSKRHHKHLTTPQNDVPQIEQLIDTLKRFDYMPPNMPNLPNLPKPDRQNLLKTPPNLSNTPPNISKRPNISNKPNISNMPNILNSPTISNRPNNSNMPNSSNMQSLVENGYFNQNVTRFDNPAMYTFDPTLREEIRNLVRSAEGEKKENRIWLVLVGLIHILQALLTTAAVVVYYLVWCYTQMMYFIMKSMLFFHNAEGSMKFAIGLVTVTSIIFAYSLVVKVERIFFRF